MAIVKLHSGIKEIRGSLGDMVFTPRGDGEAIARKKANPPETWSGRQKAHQSRFADAATYARTVQNNPELSAPYSKAAKARRLAAYQLALGDFLKAPEVQEIDLSGFTGKPGGVIWIAAGEWKVVELRVKIVSLEGAVLEERQAVFDAGSGRWMFRAESEVPDGQTVVVEATAVDRPKHTGSKSAFWAQRG